MNSNWTKEELRTYILIYCANADFIETKRELEFIKSKIQDSDYDKIHTEFEADNDYQSIQKIQSAIQLHGFKMEDTLELFEDMKHLFESDDHFSILEKNVLKGLAHIFK